MGLLDLKKYLLQVKMASLQSLANYFKCDQECLRNMMQHWVRKGCVRSLSSNILCGKRCVQCTPCSTEIYEWII